MLAQAEKGWLSDQTVRVIYVCKINGWPLVYIFETQKILETSSTASHEDIKHSNKVPVDTCQMGIEYIPRLQQPIPDKVTVER